MSRRAAHGCRSLLASTALWALGVAGLAVPGSAAGGEGAASRDVSGTTQAGRAASAERVAALRARVTELEAALRKAKKRRNAESRRSPVADGSGVVVRTKPIARRALQAKRGATDPGKLEALGVLIDQRAAVRLLEEIEALLQSGESGYAVLSDFMDFLDKDRHRQILFTAQYRIMFALMHVAALHERELAEFSHYYLVASRDAKRSYMRKRLYEFIPVFLRFHAGRFPELEEDFRRDIVRMLGDASSLNLASIFSAIHSLGFHPPISSLERWLTPRATLQELNLVTTHLVERDDEVAAGGINRLAQKVAHSPGWKGRFALSALARMTTPEADRYLRRYMVSRSPTAYSNAAMAYFSVPRDEEAAQLALRYLNAPVPTRDKKSFLGRLRRDNPDVMAALLQRREEIGLDELKDLVK